MGRDPFDVLPLTFHIESGLEDPEFQVFIQHFNQIEIEKKKKIIELQRKKKAARQKEGKQNDEYDSEEEEDDE